jgi:hypothetical protein
MKLLHADRRTWTILVCVFFKTFRCRRAEKRKVYSKTSKNKNYTASFSLGVGRDSSMDKATGYGLEAVRGSHPGRARFSAPLQTGPRAHQASYTIGTGSSPGRKAAGPWR